MKQYGLYVHIPFCIKKCYYCDFNSYADGQSLIPEYIDSIVKEMVMYSDNINEDEKLVSIYIGGGTPTLLLPLYFEKILYEIYDLFNIDDNLEITVESNPGTLSEQGLLTLKRMGVNRLSIGLQAWQDELLDKLGRIHSVSDFEDSFKLARQVGFDNINVDIMFGLPGQTMRQWMETLNRVINLGVEHLSCYSLKLEPGTLLYKLNQKGILDLPKEDLEREMYHQAVKFLKDKGYNHYEISNFCIPGKHSIHNMLYWTSEQYIGVGAGAHSHMGDDRFNNVNDLTEYIKRIKRGNSVIENKELVNKETRMNDFVMLRLRMIQGLNKHDFKKVFGNQFEDIYGKNFGKLKNMGMLKEDDLYISLSERGLDLCNSVLVELFA